MTVTFQPEEQRELTDEEIDLLYRHHSEKYCESDDVDKEEARAERWIGGLSFAEAQRIIASAPRV